MPHPAALITGGTTGIGRATAELLHAQGYDVIVTGQSPDSVATAQQELPDGILAIRSDARSASDIDTLVKTIDERTGRLDLLFLNAGITRPAPVEAIDEQTFDDLVDVNFKGQFFTLQKALPLLVDGGSIVFTTGIGVTHGVAGGNVTAATRGALLALTKSLALELAPRRIRVNSVSPGSIQTPMWDKLEVPPAMREAAAAQIPFGRFGTPTDIGQAVAFLASDAASYITGENLTVAGGSGLGA